jgi:hypothetical protein
MICPIRELGFIEDDCEETKDCLEAECAWWNQDVNFNRETKKFTGECCIKTLSNLKISGGINTHPY